MQLREKGAKKDAEPVTMGWDEAQSAIAAGTHQPVNEDPAEETEKPEKAEPEPDDKAKPKGTGDKK